jgi:hypothetical protein
MHFSGLLAVFSEQAGSASPANKGDLNSSLIKLKVVIEKSKKALTNLKLAI